MITRPSALYPLAPPLLNSKTGVYKDILFFLFLLEDIDCGYSHRTASANDTIFHLKITIFTVMKIHSILHRRVIVMNTDEKENMDHLLFYDIFKIQPFFSVRKPTFFKLCTCSGQMAN